MADKKISALTAAATPLAGTEVLPVVQSGATVKVSVADLTAGRTVALRNANLTGGAAVINVGAVGDTSYHYTRYIDNGNQSFFLGVDDNAGAFFGAGAYGRVLYSEGSNPLKVFVNGAYRAEYDTSGNYKLDTGNLVVGTAGKGIDFSANTHAAGMTSELLDWYEEGAWTGTLTAATPPTNPVTATGRYTRVGNQITVAIEFDNVDTTGASGAMEVTGLPFTATAAGYGPAMKSGIGTQVITAAVYGGLSKVTFSDAGTMTNTNIVAAAGVYLRFSVTYYV